MSRSRSPVPIRSVPAPQEAGPASTISGHTSTSDLRNLQTSSSSSAPPSVTRSSSGQRRNPPHLFPVSRPNLRRLISRLAEISQVFPLEAMAPRQSNPSWIFQGGTNRPSNLPSRQLRRWWRRRKGKKTSPNKMNFHQRNSRRQQQQQQLLPRRLTTRLSL